MPSSNSKKFSTYAFLANGAIEDCQIIAPYVKMHECIVCVDGGLIYCQKMNIQPDLIVGDFDSIPSHVLNDYTHVPFLTFPQEKNETDLELAVQSVYHPDVDKITVFGALGKRLDHTLSNLHLMQRYPRKVFFETENELIFSFNGTLEIACFPGQTISFMHMDKVEGVTSEGLQWDMYKATFTKYFFSLSNICLADRVKITIESGDLICCLQKSLEAKIQAF